MEGLVLQLRLCKTARAEERDRRLGTWHAFHIVGGAVTAADADPDVSPDEGPGTTVNCGQTALNF